MSESTSRVAAMIVISPPQFGQCSRSRSNTRFSKRVQLGQCGRCAPFASRSVGWDAATSSGSFGTTCARIFAFGAFSPVAYVGRRHSVPPRAG